MAKGNKPQVNDGQKVQTKYERKMEARKKQEEKDKRDAKMLRIGTIVVSAVIVVAIVGSIAAVVLNKQAATKGTYVTIGDHAVTKLEYDYYYNMLKNNYMSSYGSLLAYMGVDASQDIEDQVYDGNMTYKDYFDQAAVEQIQQTKALVDDAAANGFAYDTVEDYETMRSAIANSADSSGITVADYYKSMYGQYATEENVGTFMKESILAGEYYNYLIGQNAPEIQEVKDYYAEHVQDYDRVDYHSFAFKAEADADASEEDVDKAMQEAKDKADAMLKALQDGGEFKALCLENAAEENKATYEEEETDASLREGAYRSSTPSAVSGWLYEDGRAEGDLAVLEDTINNQYYVVQFVRRYYDEADDTNISNMISSERVTEYLEGLVENYAVTDVKGNLRYLTLELEDGNEETAE